MILCKVTGNVVSTKKDEKLTGSKLLIVQPIDYKENYIGNPIVAVDTVGAGIKEIVLVVTGSTARLTEEIRNAPIDASIVGIVDYTEASY